MSETPSSLNVTGSGKGSDTKGMRTVMRTTHVLRSSMLLVTYNWFKYTYNVLVDRYLLSLN